MAPGGATSRVRAIFTALVIRAVATGNSGSGLSAFTVNNAAVQSNSTITLATNGGIRLSDTNNNHKAGLLANSTITWNTVGQPKAQMNNPNVIQIDGQIMVPAAPSLAYSGTVTGMGNTNGTTNYQTVGLAASGATAAVPANSIMGMGSPAPFADSTQVGLWQTQWIAQAQGTGSITYPGNVSTSSLPPVQQNPGWGEKRVTAPAYINGDLNADGGQLYLQPNSNPNLPNTIYVHGNVVNSALLYNRGVNLIVEGSYTDTGNSALYSLQTQYTPYASTTAMMPKSSLVSLKQSSSAITLNTDSSGPAGLIYATLGGININGNNELRGVLVSGGTGSNGGVQINPRGGNSFVVWFPQEAITGRGDFLLPPASASAGAVIQPFTASRLGSWVQTQ